MNEQTKILFALYQLENIHCLIQGNEYEKFIASHLISIEVELKRQLSLLTNTSLYSKISE